MNHALEDLTVYIAGGRRIHGSVWSLLLLQDEQNSGRQTTAWAGERAVRDDFIEVVIFELDSEKCRVAHVKTEMEAGGLGVAFGRENSTSRSTEVPVRSCV